MISMCCWCTVHGTFAVTELEDLHVMDDVHKDNIHVNV